VKLQRRMVPLAIGIGVSIAGLGGTAAAAPTLPPPNQSAHSPLDCSRPGDGPFTPGQAFLFYGGAGPNRTGVPPDAVAAFPGLRNLGEIVTVCTSGRL
jgi:hypothetical protein